MGETMLERPVQFESLRLGAPCLLRQLRSVRALCKLWVNMMAVDVPMSLGPFRPLLHGALLSLD